MPELSDMDADEVKGVIDAAFELRDSRIPSTSTFQYPAVRNLLDALAQLECHHPRDQRAFEVMHPGDEQCGRCGKMFFAPPEGEPDEAQTVADRGSGR